MLIEKKMSYTDAEIADILHQVSYLYTSTKVPHDYGTGEDYTHLEVHTLKHIAENSGITVTELAKNFGKTKGAVSQLLKKIENKGLIYRQVDLDNDSRLNLFLTEKGKELNECHRQYDQAKCGETMDLVREKCSDQEITVAFHVMETWLDARREVQVRRRKRKRAEDKIKRKKA